MSWSRAGFTLVEAMMAITITAIASVALLLGLTSSIQTTELGLEEAVAQGLARQLMDEILGFPYIVSGGDPYQSVLAAPIDATLDRETSFDELGDFNQLAVSPPRSSRGKILGKGDGAGQARCPKFQLVPNDFRRWKQRVSVVYVDENDPSTRLSAGSTSNLRVVIVRIVRLDDNGSKRVLASVRRVISYVPTL